MVVDILIRFNIVNDFINALYDSIGLFQHLKFSVHGGGDSGLLRLIEKFLIYLSEVDFNNETVNPLPGLSDMVNIHPLIVHFPIALLSSFLIMELLGKLLKSDKFFVASTWMLYLGAIGAFASVCAGLLAEETIPHGKTVHEILENHKNIGISVLVLSVILSGWRSIHGKQLSGMASALNLLLAILMVSLLTVGADLGGQMVYKYGVAVSGSEQSGDHNHKVALDY